MSLQFGTVIGHRLPPDLQGVDGDGAAAPVVEVAEGVHGASAAEHHQPVEQLLLGHGEEEQRQAAL